jgi:hypothetical protein
MCDECSNPQTVRSVSLPDFAWRHIAHLLEPEGMDSPFIADAPAEIIAEANSMIVSEIAVQIMGQHAHDPEVALLLRKLRALNN